MLSHVNGLKRETNQLACIQSIFAWFSRHCINAVSPKLGPRRHHLHGYTVLMWMSKTKGTRLFKKVGWRVHFIDKYFENRPGWGYNFILKPLFLIRGIQGFPSKFSSRSPWDSFNQRLRVPEGTGGVLRLALFQIPGNLLNIFGFLV